MTDEPRTIYGQKRWVDFEVSFTDGTTAVIRALGLAVEDEDVLFFNLWTDGRPPASTRIAQTRVRSVTTDGVAKTAQERS